MTPDRGRAGSKETTSRLSRYALLGVNKSGFAVRTQGRFAYPPHLTSPPDPRGEHDHSDPATGAMPERSLPTFHPRDRPPGPDPAADPERRGGPTTGATSVRGDRRRACRALRMALE